MANETAKLRNHSTEPPSEDRLNSWKEIAAYLKCSERTVRRWEEEGLPVHRHPHKAKAAIYAYKAEIDAWWCDGRERLNQIQDLHQPATVPAPWWMRSRTMLGVPALLLALVVIWELGQKSGQAKGPPERQELTYTQKSPTSPIPQLRRLYRRTAEWSRSTEATVRSSLPIRFM